MDFEKHLRKLNANTYERESVKNFPGSGRYTHLIEEIAELRKEVMTVHGQIINLRSDYKFVLKIFVFSFIAIGVIILAASSLIYGGMR